MRSGILVPACTWASAVQCQPHVRRWRVLWPASPAAERRLGKRHGPCSCAWRQRPLASAAAHAGGRGWRHGAAKAYGDCHCASVAPQRADSGLKKRPRPPLPATTRQAAMARASAFAAALAAALLFAACTAACAAPDCGSIPGCTACEEAAAAAFDQGSLSPAADAGSTQPGRRLLKRRPGARGRKYAADAQDASRPRGLLEALTDGLPSADAAAADTGRHLLLRRGPGGKGRPKSADAQDAGKPRGLLEASADGLPSADAMNTGRHLLLRRGPGGKGRPKSADAQDAGKPRGLLEALAAALPAADAAVGTGRHLLRRGPGGRGRKRSADAQDAGRPRGLLEAHAGGTSAAPRLVCTACGTPGYLLDAAAGSCGEFRGCPAAPRLLAGVRAWQGGPRGTGARIRQAPALLLLAKAHGTASPKLSLCAAQPPSRRPPSEELEPVVCIAVPFASHARARTYFGLLPTLD